jgi:hypothetical protein
MSLTRDSLVRSIASALVFSDPPAMANLTKARAAAGTIVDALVDIGAVSAEFGGGAGEPVPAGVSANGAAGVDPDQSAFPL